MAHCAAAGELVMRCECWRHAGLRAGTGALGSVIAHRSRRGCATQRHVDDGPEKQRREQPLPWDVSTGTHGDRLRFHEWHLLAHPPKRGVTAARRQGDKRA